MTKDDWKQGWVWDFAAAVDSIHLPKKKFEVL